MSCMASVLPVQVNGRSSVSLLTAVVELALKGGLEGQDTGPLTRYMGVDHEAETDTEQCAPPSFYLRHLLASLHSALETCDRPKEHKHCPGTPPELLSNVVQFPHDLLHPSDELPLHHRHEALHRVLKRDKTSGDHLEINCHYVNLSYFRSHRGVERFSLKIK